MIIAPIPTRVFAEDLRNHGLQKLMVLEGVFMDFQRELEEMRNRYRQHPMKNIRLPRPVWLTELDEVAAIYREKTELLRNGEIYYAHIVQANELLFRRFPQVNCPGQIVYSTDELVAENPMRLQKVAEMLYSYKGKKDVPEQWRKIADVLTDEHDDTPFTFQIPTYSGDTIETRFQAILFFRKLLPGRVLRGNLLPVIAAPDKCKSVLILPPKYWSHDFKKGWGVLY